MAARRGRPRKTTSGYFRTIFEEQPALLDGRSNEELINRWKTDHPRHTEKELRKVKGNLANVKSLMRRKDRVEKRGPGRPPGRGSALMGNFVGGGRASMPHLEEHIDDCLAMAKSLDRAGLEDVIKTLRHARNLVVWKMGQ